MLIGQTVYIPALGSPGVKFYGPWMPRQGDAFSCLLEVIKASAASGWSLKMDFETKNNEDPDSGATGLANALTASGAGTVGVENTGCKELVRFVYSGTGGGSSGLDRWVHFRVNPLMWQPN